MALFPRCNVTPFVGVWIETLEISAKKQMHQVTPFVGVWIETPLEEKNLRATYSHTLRGCVD